MSEQNYDLFLEDDSSPDIPPRSTLYHCPLLGQGTSNQESLLNYLHRLARAHNLRVMDLLTRVVLPQTHINVDRGRYGFAGEYARTVNGYGKYANEISTALGGLTAVEGLNSATFLCWQNLFDGKGAGLLHPTRTWCPDCLAEAEERGEPHNFPLLWACSSVTHCRKHMCELESKCLRCGSGQQPICDSSHYGRCSACGTSLAWRSALFKAIPLPPRQNFVISNVGEMISLAHSALGFAQSENITRGLQRVAESTYGGSIPRLAKAINIEPRTLQAWAMGRKKPRFDSFLELCYRIGIRPVYLLGESAVHCRPQLRPGAMPLKRPSFKLPPEKLRDVEAEIRRNLRSDDDPIRLIDLAAKHGTSVGHLRYQLPEACKALMERYRFIRSLISEMKLKDRTSRAKRVARRLFEQDMSLPRSRIKKELQAEGLSTKCPDTRRAAYEEVERLMEEETLRLSRTASVAHD